MLFVGNENDTWNQVKLNEIKNSQPWLIPVSCTKWKSEEENPYNGLTGLKYMNVVHYATNLTIN
jgi:hypothetical protein